MLHPFVIYYSRVALCYVYICVFFRWMNQLAKNKCIARRFGRASEDVVEFMASPDVLGAKWFKATFKKI